jgi:hypothetical protein
MNQPFIVLILLSLLALACNNFGTDKSKELELKEKELALKEKELELKEKGSTEDDSDEAGESEGDSEKAEKTEKTESVNKVYTPQRNSAERKQIMDALRVPVEKELKQNVIFKVNDLKIFGDWAFLGGEPMAKSGGKPDYRGTKYEDDVKSDIFDNNIFALLKKKGGRWTIVVYYLGCTDVCYAGWWKEHGAPKEIFPYTE